MKRFKEKGRETRSYHDIGSMESISYAMARPMMASSSYIAALTAWADFFWSSRSRPSDSFLRMRQSMLS